jgi:hypothetical protein
VIAGPSSYCQDWSYNRCPRRSEISVDASSMDLHGLSSYLFITHFALSPFCNHTNRKIMYYCLQEAESDAFGRF